MNESISKLAAVLEQDGIALKKEEPLSGHTTFKIGGPARLYCMPSGALQLATVLQRCRELNVRTYLLGKGSNTLFSDAGFPGAVIQTAGTMGSIRVEGTRLIAGAGVGLNSLCAVALEQGLTGLEFAYGIPGSVGGAVYMNAGAYGGEMKDVLTEVSYLDEAGQLHTAPLSCLSLGYRTSIFEHKNWCIVQAVLQLQKGEPQAIRTRMDELLLRRKNKQPLEYPSAGSTFKRPEGAFAAALIDQCGLKGFTVGGAQVSEKHSGFVINIGGATCADVVELTRRVGEIVLEKTGYRLEREIRVVE